MLKTTQTEWLKEAKEKFGEDHKKWKFICPACGHVTSVEDFMNAGGDMDGAYQECIGRYTGKGSPQKNDSSGCNWAAYGFFGTLGKGRIIIADDSGKEVEIFQFAEETNKGDQ